MGDTYAFTIYNLQIIFADLKKIMGDTYAFTIYNLQFTNYFTDLKKSWVIHMHLQFTIYNLQFTNYFCRLKKNHR